MCKCEKGEIFLHKGAGIIDINDTIECAGTTVGSNIVNPYYLGLRIFFALYSTSIALWTFVLFLEKDGFWNYWTYITHWAFLCNTIYFWLSVTLHFKVYINVKDLDDISEYPSIDDLNLRQLWDTTLWFCQSGLAVAWFVILFYYLFVYGGGSINPNSWHTHGVVGSIITIEWFLSCWQLTYRAALTSLIVCICWILFSIVFYLAGWKNEEEPHDRYIYSAIDWGKSPGTAVAYSVVACVIIPLIHIGLVALKNWIMKKWVASKPSNQREILVVSYTPSENDENDKL